MPKKAKKKKNPEETRGRPSVFSEEVAKKIIELHGQGKTDEQVAEIIGITSQTLRNWRKSNENFLWATREAKLLADEMVEASMFKNAVGFNYYEQQTSKDGVVALRKYKAPDTKAQIFWLKNRKPKEWRDTVQLEQDANYTILVDTGDEEEEFDV